MIVRHLYISAAHNYFGHHGQPAGTAPMVEVPSAELVAGKGLVGDRFFDWKKDYKGQVTFFALEVFESLCAQFEIRDKAPWVLRRNIIVEGADLNALIGAEFDVQGVRFAGTAEAKPCYWMNSAFAEGAEAAMDGRGGLRAKVLTDGVLRSEPARSHA